MNRFFQDLGERVPLLHKRRLAIGLQIAYWLMLVPMFVISMYNYPSADDFSMTDTVHAAWVAGGGILTCVWEALKFGIHDYLTYTGYFTSAALTAFDPAVFGEQYYVIVFPLTILALTFGCRYMMRCILVKAMKADKDLASIITTLTLILMVQCMPQGLPRSEGFYWYSGTINYTFMFSMGMIYIGLLISVIYDREHQVRTTVLAALLGFFTGGGNYLTSLSVAIVTVMFLLYAFVFKKIPEGRRRLVLIASVCMLIGFAISCAGPGNAVRAEEVDGMAPIPAILLCLHYTLSYCVSEWTTWPVVVLFLLVAIAAWAMAPHLDAKCDHPVLITIFGYGLVSANICPPIYAESNIGAGRLQALFYMEYILVVSFLIVYAVRHVWRRIYGDVAGEERTTLGRSSSAAILGLAAILLVGSALDIHVDERYYTFTSAIADLVSGDAATYRAECETRREMLYDESMADVVFQPFSCRPELLFYSDIDYDAEDWKNAAMALYYGKNSISMERVVR